MRASGFPDALAAFLAASAALFIVLAISRRSRSGGPEALAASAAFLIFLAIGGWSVPGFLEALVFLVAATICAAAVGAWIGRKRATRIIASPRLGVLNLKGSPAGMLIAEDANALASLFGTPPIEEASPPTCDVLLLYCDLAPDGSVCGSSRGLYDIIDSSGAAIVIIASENSGPSCVAAAKNGKDSQINLVMMLDRKGHKATQFLARIFARMKSGKEMRSAWAELAPRNRKRDLNGLPTLLFFFRAGWLRFRNSPRR